MGYKRGEPSDITEHVHKVLARQEYDRGGASELRLESWIRKGKDGPVSIARRDKWKTEDGEERSGKAKGINASDLFLILENIREIGRIMGVPAAKITGMIQEATAPAASQPPATADGMSGSGDPWGGNS